jgi:hypothetical protein
MADELYVASREVLLDALIALEEHRESIILVGAQAVYVHAGEGDVAVAPYTTDGDLVIDPSRLHVDPDIEAVMRASGFTLSLTGASPNPGAWLREIEVAGRTIQVPLDLMVPGAVADGRRSARLPGHSKQSARRVHGLEAALVDNDWHELVSLRDDDRRIVQVRVAGPTALLIAKSFKIGDRLEAPTHRQDNKDALDCYRLMLTTPAEDAVVTLASLQQDDRSAPSVAEGVALLRQLFGAPRSDGTRMAIEGSAGLIPPERVIAVCTSFVTQLDV